MREHPWPAWWRWEIILSYHVLERMAQRGFTEIDLRTMLEHARGYRHEADSRWGIQSRWRRQNWEIIVEPDPIAEQLVVVTAYIVDRD